MTAAVQRLNHAVLYVSDVERSVAFYRDQLGFTVTAHLGNAAFLRAHGSANDHDLGLFGIGPNPTAPSRRATGLYHLAWQVDTIDDLAALRRVLLDTGSLVGESDHGVSKSLYAVDPDGIEFEVMWAVPVEEWPDVPSTDPLDLDAALARYSGVATLDAATAR